MKIKLVNSESRALFWIFLGMGNVCFAASLAAGLTLSVELIKIVVLILELGFSIIFWIVSIRFAKRGKL